MFNHHPAQMHEWQKMAAPGPTQYRRTSIAPHLAEADPLQTVARSGAKGRLTEWTDHPRRLLGDNSSAAIADLRVPLIANEVPMQSPNQIDHP